MKHEAEKDSYNIKYKDKEGTVLRNKMKLWSAGEDTLKNFWKTQASKCGVMRGYQMVLETSINNYNLISGSPILIY